jgi:hypothetical protein
MIKKWNNWLGHHPTLRRLQLIALLRSTGQGFAAVETSLYLKELGWSGTSIGALLVAAGLFRTLNTTFAAEWNALLGPKNYLLLHECLTAAAALLLVTSSGSIPLGIAVIAAGFGMGHSGSGGPAAPVERRWLGAFSRRSGSSLFGKHAMLSYVGMGTGALFASLTPLLKPWLPGEEAYRLLFAVPALCAIAGAALLLTIQGGAKRRNTPTGEMLTREQAASLKTVPHRSGRSSILLTGGIILVAIFILLAGWKFDLPLLSATMPVLLFLLLIAAAIVRVSGGSREELAGIMNILQSVAVTLTSTMSAYWFSVQFNAAAGEVGLIIALSYFLAGAMSLVLMQAAERFGPSRPVVYMQLAGAACVLLMPWSPSFGTAAFLYALCSMFNLGTRGSRYAVMNSQPAGSKRSWSSRLASFVIRLGAILWPGAFGRMLDEGEHILPFCLAAAIQVFSTSGWRCRIRTK